MQGLSEPCKLPPIEGTRAKNLLKAGKHPVKGKSLALSEHIPMMNRVGEGHLSEPSRPPHRPGEGIVDRLSREQTMTITGLQSSEEAAAKVAAALCTQPDVWDERQTGSGDEDDPLSFIDPWS